MLGHLYKDFYRHKWIMFSILCLTGFYFSMLLIVDSPKNTTSTVISYAIIALPVLLISAFSQVLISKDEKSRWLKFAISLPGGKNTYILSKYYFYILSELSGICVSLLLAAYTIYIKKYVNFIPCVMLICILFLLTMLFSSVELPFVFRFGAKKGNNFKTITLLIIFCGLLYYICMCDISYWVSKDYYTIINKINSISHLRLIISIICVLFGLALFTISYFISVRIFRSESDS